MAAVTQNPKTKNFPAAILAGAAAIILLTALAYLPALPGKFVWDDDSWTTGILQLLRNFAGLRAIWFDPTALQQYYPLSGTTFWIDYHLWGFWTTPYHIENLTLHIISALMFWRLLRLLQVPGAWLAAAIFAVHPVMVESVAWITERKNVLSMVLFLGSMLAYGRFTHFWNEPTTKRPQKTNWKAYVLAFFLLSAALTAKSTVFAMPAIVLLICWWKRGTIRLRQDVLPTLPFFAISIAYCLLTSWLEKNSVGAKGPYWDLSFAQRCIIAGHVFWFYIAKLLWPANLCFIYPRWHVDSGSPRQWLYPITAVALLLGLFLARHRIGRAPATAFFFFVGTLFPVLGFMNAYFMCYSFVCDHWTYLSSLGLIALAAALITKLADRLRTPQSLYALVPILLASLSFLTWRQTAIYADLVTIWNDTLAKNPAAWLAHNNLGVILKDQGKIPEAIDHYQLSIKYDPNFVQAYNNLGVAYRDLGKPQLAIEEYDKAIKLRPDFSKAYYNRGNALLETGRDEDAIQNYQQALKLDPNFFDPHYALGGIFFRQDKIQKAIEEFTTAVQIEPDSTKARNKLALAFARQGNFADAITQWNQALRIQPNYPQAHYNLGLAYEKIGQTDTAILQYKQELQQSPDFFQPHYNLGLIYMRLGRTSEATDQLNQAVRIQPDSADAQNNLALALAQQGQPQQAIQHWQQAVQIRPDFSEADNDLAWLLATQPPTAGGNPTQAVTLAEHACNLTNHQLPSYLDTLATAFAAAGRFNDAISTAQKAIDLANAAGQPDLATQIQSRLQLYKSGKTYGQSATTNPTNP
jgi:protein O-mannosyl-transferase